MTVPRFLVVLLILSALAASGLNAQEPRQGAKEPAFGDEVMVSSSHPAVNEAALEVLENGGNAVDAMIAAVLLQPVVEPHMSTIAGGVGALVYSADADELTYLDGELNLTRERPGGSETTSGNRIGVPGTVRGLEAAAERYGTMEWADYLEPAIQAAEEGFTMYSFLYAEMMSARARLAAHPESREIWMPDGVTPEVGETFRQPELARTLESLAEEGPDHFYTGEWAERFVEKVNDTGGRMSAEELEAYEAQWAKPVEFDYRGTRIAGAPPASNAGLLVGMILNILEDFDLEDVGHYTESAEAIVLLRQAYDQALSHVARFVGHPEAFDTPVEGLLAQEYAAQLAALIEGSGPTVDLRADEARSGASGSGSYARAAEADTDTNHLVIVDADGNWVSATHTVYGSTFATGLTVGGVGVNSGNGFSGSRTADGQGRRVITPFPATMALDDAGEPWLALGSPGMSSRAVAMTLINMLGYGMDLHEAIDTPRFQGYAPDEAVQAEAGIEREALDELGAFGISYDITGVYDWGMGSMHGVARDPETGELTGVADPRRTGHADGW